MNDIDICKRIAEIEGTYVTVISPSVVQENNTWLYNTDTGDAYNPLTDDALCFRLMVKYKIQLINDEFSEYYGAFYKGYYIECESDKSPNKAICLAIIEANKDDRI